MNNRKPILYILLIVLALILLYNYMLAPFLVQYKGGMGMGMHRQMYDTSSFHIDFRIMVLIVIVILVLILFEFFKTQPVNIKCGKCGKEIESDRWKVCPLCGTPVNKRG